VKNRASARWTNERDRHDRLPVTDAVRRLWRNVAPNSAIWRHAPTAIRPPASDRRSIVF
jgi:hypothetical protein